MKRTLGLLILLYLVLLSISHCSFSQNTFKADQLRYPRVRQAYHDKEASMLDLLKNNNIEIEKLRIYLRAFKAEKKIELWGKNVSDDKFVLLKTYSICSSSGGPGPKRRQGDYQVPEGFYNINIFNPHSNFYLSLGINYPNPSDRVLSDPNSPGGDIYIHGSCVTIGCLPITDPEIKELYIFCVEARDKGQTKIPVTIFPAELKDSKFNRLLQKYESDPYITGLWTDLKKAYDIFNKSSQLPQIKFLSNGRHSITQ